MDADEVKIKMPFTRAVIPICHQKECKSVKRRNTSKTKQENTHWSNVGSCCVLRFLVSGSGCRVLRLLVGRGSIRGGVVSGFSLSGFIRFVGFRHSNLMGFHDYITDSCCQC